MPYYEELLDAALLLFQARPATQASIRRAVSSAYYALFHFLIEEVTANWTRSEQRPALARMFSHNQMFSASRQCEEKFKKAASQSSEFRLQLVAHSLVQLRYRRERADYDPGGDFFSEIDAEQAISLAFDAIKSWPAIREDRSRRTIFFSYCSKSAGTGA